VVVVSRFKNANLLDPVRIFAHNPKHRLPLQQMAPSSAPDALSLSSLPAELFLLILSFLPNRDIKNLRLTGSVYRHRARLRLDRVFLSANPRNVDVFRAIANHDSFRKGVTEIVWDDARLAGSPPGERDVYGCYNELLDYTPEEGCPVWFSSACDENIAVLKHRHGGRTGWPDHLAREPQLGRMMTKQASWKHYQGLLQQQKDVLTSDADADALKLGLERFPALKRITVTPVAHGWLFEPFYQTPMIRDFSYGFNYLIPSGWPAVGDGDSPTEACPWCDNETEKDQWRGFRVVTRELAHHHHNVSELVIDARQIRTGVNCRIFDAPCAEYHDLVSLLRRPGFARLELALLVGGQQYEDWSSFRSGHLRRALAEARDLRHFRLTTDVEPNPDAAAIEISGGAIEHFVPLRTVFPVDCWPHLQHFGLSGFLVVQSDVVALLMALPPTVRFVELSFLEFLDGGGNHQAMLEQMRNELGWRDRAAGERPQVLIGIHPILPVPGRAIWVEDEVTEFLYADGENPFGGNMWSPNQIPMGKGVIRDTFDTGHERPWKGRA
jgi:hypothetical protein